MRNVDLDTFAERMRSESERASAVLGGALLDANLEDLFRRKLRFFQDELLRNSGPIGSFSVRIRLARALEWINEDARFDLDTIRGIRNDFAHSFDVGLSFTDRSITDRCNNLKTAQAFVAGYDAASKKLSTNFIASVIAAMRAAFTSPRSRFQLAVEFLSQYIRQIPDAFLIDAVPALLEEIWVLGESSAHIQISATGTVGNPE